MAPHNLAIQIWFLNDFRPRTCILQQTYQKSMRSARVKLYNII